MRDQKRQKREETAADVLRRTAAAIRCKLAENARRQEQLRADTATASLEALQRQNGALQAAMGDKERELSTVTMALQQAILEQKGVAESTQKWKRTA